VHSGGAWRIQNVRGSTLRLVVTSRMQHKANHSHKFLGAGLGSQAGHGRVNCTERDVRGQGTGIHDHAKTNITCSCTRLGSSQVQHEMERRRKARYPRRHDDTIRHIAAFLYSRFGQSFLQCPGMEVEQCGLRYMMADDESDQNCRMSAANMTYLPWYPPQEAVTRQGEVQIHEVVHRGAPSVALLR
jgi:hypothetical protein